MRWTRKLRKEWGAVAMVNPAVKARREVRWAEEYRGGKSLQHIAQRSGVHWHTVRTCLLDQGMTLRAAGSPKTAPEIERRVCDDYDAGMSMEEVAWRHGLAKRTVSRILHEDLARLEAMA